MLTRRAMLLGAGLMTAVAGAIFLLRPARVRSARVTAITSGNPPIASVTLAYGSGMLPVSVIVDIEDQNAAGSATIAGEQLFIEIPIMSTAGGRRRVVTTATYRILGRSHTHVQEFVPAGT